jgi:hypothetical protein
VERAAKDATTAAAAAERAFVAAKGMVDLEDRRCVCCTLAALLHLQLELATGSCMVEAVIVFD